MGIEKTRFTKKSGFPISLENSGDALATSSLSIPLGQECAGAQNQGPGGSRLAWSAHHAGVSSVTCHRPVPRQHLSLSACIKIPTALSLDSGSKANLIFFLVVSVCHFENFCTEHVLFYNEKKKSINIIFRKGYTIDWKDNLHEMPRGNETPKIKFSLAISPETPMGKNSLSFAFWDKGPLS